MKKIFAAIIVSMFVCGCPDGKHADEAKAAPTKDEAVEAKADKKDEKVADKEAKKEEKTEEKEATPE